MGDTAARSGLSPSVETQEGLDGSATSIPIAGRKGLPRRCNPEQFARERYGLAPDWLVFKWEVIGASKFTNYRGIGCMVTGMVVREVISRAPRKGTPHWRRGLKETQATYPVIDAEYEPWRLAWERDTGLCNECEGDGRVVWSIGAGGTKYRDCKRCSASGRAPAQGIEARRAETGTGSVHESPVAEGDAPISPSEGEDMPHG